MKRARRYLLLSLAILYGVLELLMTTVGPASAASLTNTYIRLNRMAAGQSSTFRLVFKVASSGAASVAVDFNGSDVSSWTTNGGVLAAQGSQTIDLASCATQLGLTAIGGTPSVTVSGSNITVTGLSGMSAGSSYCIDYTYTSAVTNAAAAEYHPTITVGSDTTTVAIRTVTSDQIVVNATVPSTFNMAIGGCSSNIDNFTSSLSPSNVIDTAGCTITVNTNAKNGWTAWAKDASDGLHSVIAGATIASRTPGTNATLSSGADGYVLGITGITQGSGSGTTSTATAYGNGTGGVAGLHQGSGLDGSLRSIASSTGTAGGTVLNLRESASVSPTTSAGNDYTDTITIIGAGTF